MFELRTVRSNFHPESEIYAERKHRGKRVGPTSDKGAMDEIEVHTNIVESSLAPSWPCVSPDSAGRGFERRTSTINVCRSAGSPHSLRKTSCTSQSAALPPRLRCTFSRSPGAGNSPGSASSATTR